MSRLYEKIENGDVYIIAEMSANHAGSIDNALEIVRKAAEAGADCVKIQTYTADTITIDCDKEDFVVKNGLWDGYKLYDLYTEAATPWEWQSRIKNECEKYGVDFLSTPFDKTAVDFLESIDVDSYKIASYELVDIPLIKYVASKGKTVILSCGMGSLEEINEAVEACYSVGNKQVVLLKCCSEYPAIIEDMNLLLIQNMKKDFGLPVGLSDHSSGYEADQLAVAVGACVIEKHVCLSRELINPDSGFSMEIEEFAMMVKKVRNTKKILGNGEYVLTEREQEGLSGRRSLYVVEDMKKGDVFSTKNVRSIRPAFGIKPKYLSDILGKNASDNIERGTALTWEMIE